MLRTLGSQSRGFLFSLRDWADRLAQPLALGAAAFLMANIRPAAGAIPFAWALLAAALMTGVQPVFLLAGCLAGTFLGEGPRWCIPMGTACVLAGAAAVELADRLAQGRGSSFFQRKAFREGAASVLAGVGALVPVIPAAAGDPWQSLPVLASAAAAAAAAPLMMAWIRVQPGRRHLMPGERTGLMTFLGAVLAGLGAFAPPVAHTAAYAGVLAISGSGPGPGAIAGLAAGGALLLTGGDAAQMAGLGVCGLMAGMAPPRDKWAAPVLLTAGSALAVMLFNIPVTMPLCALAACAGVLAVPGKYADRMRMWLSGESDGGCDPDRLALRLRAETGRKLRALSAAFGELSEGYRMPVDIPDEQTLIADMRENLCENCTHYEVCWAGNDNRAVRFLCQLISEAIEWGNGDHAHPLFDDEPPPDLLRACRRGRSVAARLGPLLEDFARTRRTEMKRSAVNQLISAQFMQAQLLLQGMAEAQSGPVRIRGRQAARARAALDQANIPVDSVTALRGARSVEIAAALQRGRWTPDLAEKAAQRLSAVFGRAYAPGESPGSREMKFVRLPQLRAAAAAGSRAANADRPSGDSHMIRMLQGDRMLMMISDGMGSGEAAARESAQTLRLLWQFLSADVSLSLALDTVNELMLTRTGEDMFATVDLCIIDLAAGTAEFTKLAACKSYILRGEEILEIEGGRLPLGILEQVQPATTRVHLLPGDLILMGSDGVMDAIDENTLCACFARHRHLAPNAFAEAVLSEISEHTTSHRDDKTLLLSKLSLDPVAAAQVRRSRRGLQPAAAAQVRRSFRGGGRRSPPAVRF